MPRKSLIGSAEHFAGYVDLAQMVAYRLAGESGTGTFGEQEEAVPAELAEPARRLHVGVFSQPLPISTIA